MNESWRSMRQRLSRREMFDRIGLGFGSLALRSMLAAETERTRFDVAERAPHFAPKAKRVIMLFQNGGPSQVDLFDPKPQLARWNGEKPGDGYVNPVDV